MGTARSLSAPLSKISVKLKREIYRMFKSVNSFAVGSNPFPAAGNACFSAAEGASRNEKGLRVGSTRRGNRPAH